MIAKFGGTSVATAARWESILSVIEGHLGQDRRVIVVCSALSGVTNALEVLLARVHRGEDVEPTLDAIWQQHASLARDLGCDAEVVLGGAMGSLRAKARALCHHRAASPRERAEVMAHGELMSTRLGATWLAAHGVPAQWVDCRSLLRARAFAGGGEAQRYLSATCEVGADPELCARIRQNAAVVVTQGFIASDERGDTVLLGRGGSDTSAAYLASKLDASRLEIWTDVHGMFTANPIAVPDARLVPELTYGEAQTLAALGARVLHPRCLRALSAQNIPLWLGATQEPGHGGTVINGFAPRRGVKAIVSRDALCLLSMRRPAEWQPVGFMADVASCFGKMGISMDLVSSSPGEIRATVDVEAFPDVTRRMDELVAELGRVSQVRFTTDLSSVSLVGHRLSADGARYPAAMRVLHDVPAQLIAHAADDSSLTYVVERDVAPALVERLHAVLFGSAAATPRDVGVGPAASLLGPSFRELSAVGAPRPAKRRATVRKAMA